MPDQIIEKRMPYFETIEATDWDQSPIRGGAPAEPLAKLSKKQRQIYQEVFELIYECSTNRVAAKSLVDRMLTKLN